MAVAKRPAYLIGTNINRGLSRPAEVKLHTVEGGPQIQALRDELRTVIHPNRLRLATLRRDPLQDPYDIVSRQPLADLNRQTLAAMVIDERQKPMLQLSLVCPVGARASRT